LDVYPPFGYSFSLTAKFKTGTFSISEGAEMRTFQLDLLMGLMFLAEVYVLYFA